MFLPLAIGPIDSLGCRIVNVGILVNPHKPDSLPTLHALRAALTVHGCTAVLDEETAALAGEVGGIPTSEFSKYVDIAAVLGGDGTMLNALSRLGNFQKPVAGINIGTLGFLTSCKDDELSLFAAAIATGNFSTSIRTLLEATVHRPGKASGPLIALNEITLARGETGRLVSLRASVNGELLNDYRADGLIVATPTGSTAYSLSAGGPLIAPDAAVFVITPICPHSLSQRSLILSDDSVIELSAEDRDCGPMLFTVDGRDSIHIEIGDRIKVKKAARSFHLLRLPDRSFYEALRQKLRWQGV
ncbi:MAG: NAD(+)/NADH kinase [Luteolibacter sp.]